MKIRNFLLFLFLCFTPIIGFSTPIEPIEVNKAFAFSAKVLNQNTIQLNWQISPGYYLYQERIKYDLISPPTALLSDAILPPPVMKTDKLFGSYAIYDKSLQLNIPVSMQPVGTITLDVNYQGCSSSGYCYPPMAKQVQLNLLLPGSSSLGIDVTPSLPAMLLPVPASENQTPVIQNSQDHITQLLAQDNLFLILLSFLGFGLLLTFTPCVLPMIPILSGIILGQGKDISSGKAFRIAIVYVLSMSVTYAVAGVLAGLAGSTLQAAFQNPWILGSFSIVFVLLALSLFGFYDIKIPNSIHRFALFNQKQRGGQYIGVAIMGCLATLIVSPCVTPALIGALLYIGQSGNASLGGLALFTMSIGMGIPLIILATFGGKLLPKTGEWMNTVKSCFGILMLAVALWLIGRIIPTSINLILWAALLIISAIYMGALEPTGDSGWRKLWKGLAWVIGTYGILLLIGVSMGNTDPFHPLKQVQISNPVAVHNKPMFKPQTIKTIEDLQQILRQAKAQQKPVVLDFYADWCVECQIIEKEIFHNPALQTQLSNIIVIQADVTANDAKDKALEAYLNVFAPPTMLFFNKQGEEVKELRVVGEINADMFTARLVQIR